MIDDTVKHDVKKICEQILEDVALVADTPASPAAPTMDAREYPTSPLREHVDRLLSASGDILPGRESAPP